MKLYFRLLIFIKPYRFRLAMGILCGAGAALSQSTYPLLIQPIMDDLFIHKNRSVLVTLPFIVLAIVLLKAGFQYAQGYLMRFIGNRIVADLRQLLYHKMMRLPVSYHDAHSTGQLISFVISDVALMQAAVSTVAKDIVQQGLTLIGLAGVIVYQNFRLGMVSLLTFPFIAYLLTQVSRRLRNITGDTQVNVGSLTSQLQQTFSSIRLVKGFGQEDFEAGHFSKKNKIYFKNIMRATQLSELTSPIVEAIGGLGAAGVIWYGAHQVIAGQLTPGQFFSFLAASMMLYGPIKTLGMANNALQQAMAAAERVFEILDETDEQTLDEEDQEIGRCKGAVEFKNVSFSYNKKGRGVSEINLNVKPGEMIAIVGRSGAGKSTLVNLLLRFYDPKQGEILLDGIPIQKIKRVSLRHQIGVVSQEVMLLEETVRENITYGTGAVSEEKIREAARNAYADDFINKMPYGYDTRVKKMGGNFSMGERQRLAIARALLKDPPILVMDEATSALDAESEFMVRQAMVNLMAHRTVFVIAHRLHTVHNASLIVVMEEGRIVERGRHADLLCRGGPYQRIYNMQFLDLEAAPPAPRL